MNANPNPDPDPNPNPAPYPTPNPEQVYARRSTEAGEPAEEAAQFIEVDTHELGLGLRLA